ncbi:hypothetical protein H7U32_09410, partial [Bifidobacterium pullorum subsp. saeculare]|nr:hypothetical protein [Bifidobacterium pullorum subsp. saeculare]
LMDQAAATGDEEAANKIYQQGEEILLKELPAIPLYYSNANGVASKNVSNVKFTWQNLPAYRGSGNPCAAPCHNLPVTLAAHARTPDSTPDMPGAADLAATDGRLGSLRRYGSRRGAAPHGRMLSAC